MFDNLSERLTEIIRKTSGKDKLTEDNMQDAYDNAVLYLECMQINNYDQTINHLYLSGEDINTSIPEFICINTIGEDDSEPDIEITLV